MVQYRRFNVDIDGDASYFSIPEPMYFELLKMGNKLEIPPKQLIENHIIENGFSNDPIGDLLKHHRVQMMQEKK